jgi:hypothetical protein
VVTIGHDDSGAKGLKTVSPHLSHHHPHPYRPVFAVSQCSSIPPFTITILVSIVMCWKRGPTNALSSTVLEGESYYVLSHNTHTHRCTHQHTDAYTTDKAPPPTHTTAVNTRK